MSDITILLAEDDAGQEDTIRRALKLIDESWDVEVVRDGVEVLDYLFAMGSHSARDARRLPQLILLDFSMPKMGGMQVMHVLRRVRCGDSPRMPPVVMLTANSEDAEQANCLGPFTSLHKPVDFEQFVEDLRRVTLHWLTWIEPRGRHKVSTN